MRRAPLLALLTALAAVLAAPPALAAFNVCNKSDLATRVALGRFDGTHWTSQGWWTVAPKTCARLLTGPLQARYYYLYATDGAAGTWEGKTHFCIAPGDEIPGPRTQRLRRPRLRPARLFRSRYRQIAGLDANSFQLTGLKRPP